MNERPGQELALVVGAGGLGMAIAGRLGASYRLLLADRDGDHLHRQVTAMQAEGHDIHGVVCDVTEAEAVARMASAAAESGPAKAVVHVVGLFPSMADGPAILRTNLVGPALVADAFGPTAGVGMVAVFIASLGGHLVEVSSPVMSVLSDPLAPRFIDQVVAALDAELTPELAYQLSKAALIRLCQRRAPAWGRRGARILSLSPGLIATPSGAAETEAQPEKRRLAQLIPMGREGTIVEVADVVEFLVSDRASYITGTDVLVDGGVAAAVKFGD